MFHWAHRDDSGFSSFAGGADSGDDDGDSLNGEGGHRYAVGETKGHGGGGGGGSGRRQGHAEDDDNGSKMTNIAPLMNDLDPTVAAAILTQVRRTACTDCVVFRPSHGSSSVYNCIGIVTLYYVCLLWHRVEQATATSLSRAS